MAESTRSSLQIIVSTVPGVVYTRNRIPLRIFFENTGTGEVTLLRHFQPFPVFFSVDMTREDGTPINIPGAGKISFYEGSIEYILLREQEIFGFEFDLAAIMPASAGLKAGRYKLSVTYHNQYGENCFQGKLFSDSINIKID